MNPDPDTAFSQNILIRIQIGILRLGMPHFKENILYYLLFLYNFLKSMLIVQLLKNYCQSHEKNQRRRTTNLFEGVLLTLLPIFQGNFISRTQDPDLYVDYESSN
jgi:hypothetical protein